MQHLPMTERHALKFAGLTNTQQQRTLKKLEQKARTYSLDKENNNGERKEAAGQDAKHYEWQRRVRLSREARAIHLIRAFLKGTPYQRVENSLKFHTMPAAIVVQEYMPFTHTTMQSEFTRTFNNWLAAEVGEKAVAA